MTREKLTQMLRSLKTIHRLDRAALPVHAAVSIVSSLLSVAPLVVSARLVTGLQQHRPTNELILLALVGSVLIFLLSAAVQVLEKHARVHSENSYYQFEFSKSRKALTMDYQELDSENTRCIRDRISTDRSWGGGMYSVLYGFASIVRCTALTIIATVLVAPLLVKQGFASAGWTVAFLAGVIAVTLGSIAYVSRQDKKGWAFLQTGWNKARIFIHLIGSGIRTPHGKDIRIYDAQHLIRQRGAVEAEVMIKGMAGQPSRIFGASNGISSAVSGAIQGSAYLYVALQALSGALDIGSVFLYAGAIHQFSEGISQLMRSCGNFAMSCGRMQSSYDFCDIPDTLYKGTIPVERRRDNDYVIEFHDVGFRYPGSDNWALRGLNLKLHIGERMAVVGRNGSGKTTMIKLLCRLYDPTEGTITLNGVDIRKYDYNSYLKLFSVVFQDFQLYAFPLDQNVAASVQPDGDRAAGALEKAGFGERLKTMGLKTHLYKDFDDDGVEISGGEAQKIALARALYKGAPFVILDEPTAALDPIAEFDIYSRFNDIVGNRTAVYISHRLSSCRFCQNIAVFHEGRLVQRGSHDVLMTNPDGMYHALWTAQAQYYQQEQERSA